MLQRGTSLLETDLDEQDEEIQPLNSSGKENITLSPSLSTSSRNNDIKSTKGQSNKIENHQPRRKSSINLHRFLQSNKKHELINLSFDNESLITKPPPTITNNISNQLKTTETIIEELRTAIRKGNGHLLEECLHDCHELIDARDDKGRTLMLLASEISDPECLKILLEAGADAHAIDRMGRGGLHWVLDVGCHCEICSNKNVKCLELLFQYGANPNAEDINGETPLHFAAKNMLPKCAQILLDHGADIDYVSKAKHVGYLMVQKIPEVLRSVLDKGILYDEQDSSKLKLDFGWILNSAGVKVNPVSMNKSVDSNSINNNNDHVEGQQCSSSVDDVDEEKVHFSNQNLRRRRETDLLIRMLRAHRSGREALLTHPWTEAFLYLKWLSVRKWFWIIRIIYGLMLILYSFFIFNIFILSCPPDDIVVEDENLLTETTTLHPETNTINQMIIADYDDNDEFNVSIPTTYNNKLIQGEEKVQVHACETSIWMNFMGIFVGLSVGAMIFNEIYEFIQDRHVYVQTYLNLGWWTLITCIICTIPPAFGVKPRQWQYPMAAFGLFFAWGMNLTQIGRVPAIGVYVEMLGKVLKDFGIFLITYASLMIAFTLGMCVMFPKNEYFKSVPLAFIKSLLMMIGENDYNEIFEGNSRLVFLEYSIPAHVMYAAFIFIITIVMMNLLLGLAVSDIQELRKHSTVTRISRQIAQIVLVESLFYSKCFPQRMITRFFPSFSVDSHIERYFRFSPTDPDDTCLPDDLKQKFVPYLTSSPCLNKQTVLRRVLAVSRWKAARRKSTQSYHSQQEQTQSISSPSFLNCKQQDRDNKNDNNPRKLWLQNLNDSVLEIKNQLKELNEKILQDKKE